MEIILLECSKQTNNDMKNRQKDVQHYQWNKALPQKQRTTVTNVCANHHHQLLLFNHKIMFQTKEVELNINQQQQI